MSRRKPDRLYSGARGRLELSAAAKLGRRYAVQSKLDGIYATVLTGRDGLVSCILTRSGEPLSPTLMTEFAGVRWQPNSVLHAEVELWTEASNRAAQRRGYRKIHVFDALRVYGTDVSRLRYRERRDWLMRGEAALANHDPDQPWTTDPSGRRKTRGAGGRWARKVPMSWRRMSVVPQLPATHAERAWADWVRGDEPVEGLVVVALDAPLGARSAKRKVKEISTLDCHVIDLDRRACMLFWPAAGLKFATSNPAKLRIAAGDIVEVAHEGFFDSGVPKFARVKRVRHDLSGLRESPRPTQNQPRETP